MGTSENFVPGQGVPGPSMNAAMAFITTHLHIRFLDPWREPLRGARVRLASDPNTLYVADREGIALIPWTGSPKPIEIEWEDVSRPDIFPWKRSFVPGIRTGGDGDCEKRLLHLGFMGDDLAAKVLAFQDFAGLTATGRLVDISASLVNWHDGGAGPGGKAGTGGGAGAMAPVASTTPPPGQAPPSSSGVSDAELRAMAAEFYEACNAAGILGIGTDEEAIMHILGKAKDRGCMPALEAMYRKTYPDDLTMVQELDDELSGDEYDQAMALYQAGMAAGSGSASGSGIPSGAPGADGASSGPGGSSSQAGAATGSGATDGPENPVHGTLAPEGKYLRVQLLDWGREPVPFALCRRKDDPEKATTADAHGLAAIPVKRGEESVELEWGMASETAPDGCFLFGQTFKVATEGEDDRSLSNRLWNLGFEGTEAADQLEQFRLSFGYTPSGDGEEPGRSGDARADLDKWMLALQSPVVPLTSGPWEPLPDLDGESAAA